MRTTVKDFKFFCSEVNYWLEFFNLSRWDVGIYHGDRDEPTCGSMYCSTAPMSSTIRLGKDWGDDEVNPYNVSATAFHEVVELLICKLKMMAFDSTAPSLVHEEGHCVINTLQATVWKPNYERRFKKHK